MTTDQCLDPAIELEFKTILAQTPGQIIRDVYPTIEFKSETDSGIQALLAKFSVSKAQIIGPSVTAVRDLLEDS